MKSGSKSKQSKSGHANNNPEMHASAPSASPVFLPPASGAPSPPSGFVPPAGKVNPALLPTASQVTDAASASSELRAAASAFTEDFGSKGPLPIVIAGHLDDSVAWSAEVQAAHAWLAYVSACARSSWAVVFNEMAPFQHVFQSKRAYDPTLVKRYPHLAAFFEARSKAAQRGAVMRKAKIKATNEAHAAAKAEADAAVEAKPAEAAPTETVTNGHA